jgi:hypothetical protein
LSGKNVVRMKYDFSVVCHADSRECQSQSSKQQKNDENH